MSRDGRWIASSDDQNRMHLYDAATNRLLRSYDAVRPSGEGLMLTAFSPDSRQLAVILDGQRSTEPVRLLDPNTMQPTTKLDFPGGKPVWGVDVGFSADGRYLAATVQTVFWPDEGADEAPGYAVVWDLRSPSTPPIRVPTGTEAQVMALSPDGRILYTGWPLTAYDVATGKRIWRRADVTIWGPLDVNAEGTLLALADLGSEARSKAALVSASTGATVHTLRGHRDQVRDIRFSPDGSLVGSHSGDGELIVWDTATGRPLERWDTSAPWGVGFSPDGDLVYEGGGDSMLRTWDRSMEDTYLQQTTQVDDAEVFAHADLSPDGQQVAYRWLDDAGTGWVRFVDTVTGEATPPTRAPGAVDDLWSWRHLASRRRAVRRARAAWTIRARPSHRDRPRLHHGQGPRGAGARRRRRLLGGVRRRGPQPARGRRQGPDLPPRRRDPSTPRARPSTIAAHAVHPDRGREHRDGPRGLRRRHLRALAGDRRQHRRRPVRGGPGPASRTPRLPLRTARRSRWRGTPARS